MNCKPGDIAYVIRAVEPMVIGRIVRVVEWTDCDDWGFSGWIVEFVGDTSELPSSWRGAACPDANLRPISGLPVSEEARDEVHA